MNRVGNNLIHTGSNRSLLAVLIEGEVDFVVVGGLAVAWYCPERQADDMDLLINPTAENSKRISTALASLQLSGFDPGSFAKLGLQVPLKQIFYAELLTPKDVGPSFEQIAATSQGARLFDFPVRVASPESLIQMKRQATSDSEAEREKHLADIRCLKNYFGHG